MAKQTWLWNKFYWGLWDYSNIVTDTDMTKYGNESYAVDGRKNPEWVVLWQYLTTAEYIVDWDITAYFDLSELSNPLFTWVIAITKTGKVYLNWILKHTFTGWSAEIYDLSVLNWYVYYFWPYWIHRSDLNMTNFLQNHKTFINHWYTQTKILNNANKIYFSSWNYINTLDTLEVVTEWVCVLSKPYLVTWIVLYQDYLKIYAKTKTNWQLALWKINSENSLPDQIVPFLWLPVIWVTGEWGIEYAVMWYDSDYSDLYIIQWLSKPVMLVSNPEGDISERKFNWVISTRWGLIYLWWKINWRNCLFSYGKYHKWYPDSLQVEWYTGNITALYPRTQDILFWNNTDWINPTRSWIQYIWNRTWFHQYTDFWEITSLVFNGWIRTVKNIETVEIYFNNDNLYWYNKFWWPIALYARTKKSNSWKLIKTINTTDELKGFVRLARQEFWDIGSFNQIELKLRLTSVEVDWSFKISPLITSVVLNYEDNLNK